MDELIKNKNLNIQIINAAKWSSVTEIAAKLVSPITNMILARLIAPEAFGVVATVTMIISFADMFADSGFQKYLIQHEFDSDVDKYNNANIAFWTNFGISIFLCSGIILLREQIAGLVGNLGLGNVIAIAGCQLPLTAFSSIQMALYRRDFKFKTLFFVRIASIFIPFAVTIPLALLGLSYWALIIGSLVISLSNAVILTIKSEWKPKFTYNVKILIEMLSFSIWSLIEAISIWLTTWSDIFIIGNAFNQYYLGLYKTSVTMINALMSLITASIIPILFVTLSRLQFDEIQFKKILYKFQKLVSLIIFPLGVGVYLYSDLATQILLGSQWSEASKIIGVWALAKAISIVLCHFSSEAYRGKGKPMLSFLAQMLYFIFLVPACIISSNYGFWPLVYIRSAIITLFVLIHLIIMKVGLGMPVIETFRNVFSTATAAVLMGFFGYYLKQLNNSLLWSFTSIILCSLFYFGILLFFADTRKEILSLLQKVMPKSHM